MLNVTYRRFRFYHRRCLYRLLPVLLITFLLPLSYYDFTSHPGILFHPPHYSDSHLYMKSEYRILNLHIFLYNLLLPSPSFITHSLPLLTFCPLQTLSPFSLNLFNPPLFLLAPFLPFLQPVQMPPSPVFISRHPY